MARIVTMMLITAASLAGFASIAAAQGRASNSTTVPESCQAVGAASRTRASACEEGSSEVLSAEQAISIAAELPTRVTTVCGASVGVQYFQRNTMASVKGTIQVEGCPAAAAGQYTIAARVRDESGETKALEFPATFERSDDQNVEFEAEYPIGDNVELVGLRARGVRCTCADEADAQAEAAAETPAAPQTQ